MDNKELNLKNFAHDLNNIMAVIKLYAQLGIRDATAGEAMIENLKIILDQAGSAISYINRLNESLKESAEKKAEGESIVVPAEMEGNEEITFSRERLKILLSNLPGLAYRCKNAPGWPMEFISEGCYQLTGYKPDDFIQSEDFEFEDIIHPDDRQYVHDTIQAAVGKGLPFTLEYRIRTKSGIEKRVWEKGRQINAVHEDDRLLEGFIMDISERVHVEEALKLSEEKYSKVFKTSPVAIVITRMEDGMIIDVNPGFDHIFGYSRRESIGNTSLMMKLWANPPDRDEVVSDLQKKKKVYNREYKFRHKSGEIRMGLYSAELFTIHNVPCLLSSVSDITMRKRAEEALKASQEKLMGIFRVSPSGIGVLKDRVFLEVNDRVCEMTGYSRDELIGHSAMMLYADHHEFDYVGNEKYRQIEQKGISVVETRWKIKDGTICNILLASTPIISGDNSQGVIFTALDISNLKKVEAERRRIEEQLIQAQKMEIIGKLAGGVAHEFNNTLQIITTLTELSMMKLEQEHPVSGHLEQIRNTVRQSSGFVGQLLAFARKQPVNPEIVNLNSVVDSVLQVLQRLIGENIDLSWQPETNLWKVMIDPIQVNQLLLNLTLNARDAMNNKGLISIATSNELVLEPMAAENQEFKPGEYVLLSLADNGCGMDETTLSRIFEPFFTTKPRGKGTGLGLSTVYGIVSQNKGFILADSKPGEGTVFRIYFPRLIIS